MRTKERFFSKDRQFYKTLFKMLLIVALQNLIAYSVNMVDNIMLGRYSQEALSGAATINQIFFLVEQFALSVGNALVVLCAQYWGKSNVPAIRKLAGIALRLGIICSLVITFICAAFPQRVIAIFTSDSDIAAQAGIYLSYIQITFILFMLSSVIMAALRSAGIVKISFYTSLVSLGINIVLDYFLIYGIAPFPEMGIRGAAIATVISRVIELAVVLIYSIKIDKKLVLFKKELFIPDKELRADYTKVYLPIMASQVLWGVSVPMQTAILGHLSADAIAANSVATTFYQYLKVVVISMSSVSAVLIGNAIGQGDDKKVRSKARSLSVIDIIIGCIMALILAVLSKPLLSLYTLNPSAEVMAYHLMIIMCVVMVGMSYQMPVSFGIIQGAGNTSFTMKMNLISTWCIVMPLSFMSAFWWKMPVEIVVIFIQSDQLFKCIPTFIKFRRYDWIRHLTREE